jgi:hypothetical protein
MTAGTGCARETGLRGLVAERRNTISRAEPHPLLEVAVMDHGNRLLPA